MAARLFGIKNSNRNLTEKKSWGKNVFNNTFPAALAAYMHSREVNPVYLALDESLSIVHSEITVRDLFMIDPLSDEMFFGFEMDHSPYQGLVIGSLERADLISCKRIDGLVECLRPLEIKLTVIPDESTHRGMDDTYGCELVVRSPTVLYTALSIALEFRETPRVLLDDLSVLHSIDDWESATAVMPFLSKACDALDAVARRMHGKQKPIMMQPIWKTDGKASRLHNDCLDLFVWSDLAFTRLFVDSARADLMSARGVMTRQMRSALWVAKMLYDFAIAGQINYKHVIESLTYNTKSDKAFSASGIMTRKYMKGKELTAPRIKKEEIKNIILGGGEKLLSPERRFDAMIVNTPGLFD